MIALSRHIDDTCASRASAAWICCLSSFSCAGGVEGGCIYAFTILHTHHARTYYLTWALLFFAAPVALR